MASKIYVYVLIPRICKCSLICKKGICICKWLRISKWGDYSRLSRCYSNPMRSVLKWKAQRKRQRENGSGDWNNVAAIRRMLIANRIWQRQKKESPYYLQREYRPSDTLILDLWPPEMLKKKKNYFKIPSSW